VTAIEGN